MCVEGDEVATETDKETRRIGDRGGVGEKGYTDVSGVPSE